MALKTKARPEASTDDVDNRPKLKEIVSALVDSLGDDVIALVAGAANASVVRRWADGAQTPPLQAQGRLRTAWTVAELIARVEPRRGLRAWFLGANPYLDGMPPAQALGKDPQGVIMAAQTFIAHG